MQYSRSGGPSLERMLSWGRSTTVTSTLTIAPSITNYTIFTPSGASPTQADLNSHRYHHHTQIHSFGGRVWVMSSSSLNNEDAAGQMAIIFSSADNGSSWSSATTLIPSQSVMDDTTGDGNKRVCWPRCFVEYASKLYAVVNVQTGSTANALALLAAECKSDGTLGTVFLVSPSSYTPIATFPSYSYDNTLSPGILSDAILYGIWGGSVVGGTTQAWTGWLSQDGDNFTEPTTFCRNGSSYYQRLWRKTTGSYTSWWWIQESYDSGSTWSPLYLTNIPNAPASGDSIVLDDGRITFVANMNGGRDPLYLALFNKATGSLSSIYAVRQGVSQTPVYSGTGKAGGAQYPGIHKDGTNLWISYSLQKESIGVSKIPLSGI